MQGTMLNARLVGVARDTKGVPRGSITRSPLPATPAVRYIRPFIYARQVCGRNCQFSSIIPRACPSDKGPREFDKQIEDKEYEELTRQIEQAACAAVGSLQGTSIYLVGMMGSGKSTVGKMLSQALGYCFFDTDALIEQLAGKNIPEIFAQDGEQDFRSIETQVLQELAPFKNCVISTGGGAPTKAENWGHMQGGISVWLNGPPELLASRVMRDGTENRPLLSNPEGYEATIERLRGLLDERYECYSFADLTVSLEGGHGTGAPAAVIAHRVLAAINDRIARDTAWREERKNFEVVNEDLPPTMRVVKSINPTDPYLP
jgi:shikimate kinase